VIADEHSTVLSTPAIIRLNIFITPCIFILLFIHKLQYM